MSHDSSQPNLVSGITGGFIVILINHVAVHIPMGSCGGSGGPPHCHTRILPPPPLAMPAVIGVEGMEQWRKEGRREGGKEASSGFKQDLEGEFSAWRKRLKTRQAVSLLGSVLCGSVTSVSQCRVSTISSQGKKEDMLSLFFRWCVPNWVMFMSGLFAVTPLPHSNGRHGITSFATLMWMAAHCSAAQPAACKVSQYAPSSISHSLCCLALWEL